ncbi:MAG: TolC family protein [Candidatus Cyclobacteriaceae bacterium M3_2C_046]
MKKIAVILFLYFISSWKIMVQGQEQVDLTLQEALTIALKNNVDLNQQENLMQSYEADKRLATYQFTPSLSANLRGSIYDGRFFDQTKGEIVDTKVDNVGGNITASISLFDGFRRIHNLKAANMAMESWKKNLIRTEQTVIMNVAEQYLNTLLSKELLRIAQEHLLYQRALLNQIKNFYEAGTRTIVDQYNQESQVQNQEVEVIRTENNYQNALATLGSLLMLDPATEINLSDPDKEVENLLLDQVELADLFEEAQQHRPDLKQIDLQIKSNKQRMAAASSNYIPSLSAFAQYSTSYTSSISEYEDISSGEVIEADFNYQFFTLNPSNVVGLNLSIPIWDQYLTRNQQVTAKVRYENTVLDQKNLERTIYNEVQMAYNNYQMAVKNYYASEAQFKAAEKALELQKESYDLGLGNLVELTQSNNNYILAAANRAQANYTLMFQDMFLDFATGTLSKISVE